MHSGLKTYYAIKGGIGDFLQCLPFMLTHPWNRYYVASHCRDVTLFFKRLDLNVIELPLGLMNGFPDCPRQSFFDVNPFFIQPPIFTDSHFVIGIHLGGSDYSLSTEKRFGFPSKALPRTMLDQLVSKSEGYNFLLFGSPKELDELDSVEGPVHFVRSENVSKSLGRVSECSVFIGSDSAFKTMSAMLRIPTIVLVGDYRDDHRDKRFIEPYVDAGVMSTFRYKDLTYAGEVEAAVEFCLNQLEVKCLASRM